MAEGRGGVEEEGVDLLEGRVVVVLDRVPEGRGVRLGEGHDALCVAVADEVGLLDVSALRSRRVEQAGEEQKNWNTGGGRGGGQ